MKVLFISEYNSLDPHVRSGVPYYIVLAIKALQVEVDCVKVEDQRTVWQRAHSRIRQFWYRKVLGGRKGFYDAAYSLTTALSYKKAWKGIDFSRYNVVLSISPKTVAFLPEGISLVLWIDNTHATFATYPGMEKLSPVSLREGLHVEKIAFTRAEKIFTASAWLKNQLNKQYPEVAGKTEVMPRGANITVWPDHKQVVEMLEHKMKNLVLNLVHVVSGWWETDRKGSQMVLEVFRKLKLIIPVQLTMIGAIPETLSQTFTDEGIECIGRIDKATPFGLKCYTSVIGKAHFMFIPSKAEGFGIVYAEAAALGVPSLALSVMGVTEAVQQGITGWLLPLETTSEQWVAFILEKWSNRDEYVSLTVTARKWAEKHYNWKDNLLQLLETGGNEKIEKSI